MELSLDTIKIICKFYPKSFYKVNKYFTDYYLKKITKSATIIQKFYKKWIKNKFYIYKYIDDNLYIEPSIRHNELGINYNITINLPPILNLFEVEIFTNNEKKRNKNKKKKITNINRNKFNKINKINKRRNNFNKKKRNFKIKL